MALEIERKFLVKDESYKKLARQKHHIIQGYLSRRKESTVRIRIKDEKAFITIKGATLNASRKEWEYDIPLSDANEMIKLCEGKLIEKTRWIVDYAGKKWEIDEFTQPIGAATIAEVELADEGENIKRPHFVGEEVTGNPAYYNSNL